MDLCLKRGDGAGWLALAQGRGASSKGGGDNSLAVKRLAGKLDVEALGKNFGRFAGADEKMDSEEFERFTKSVNISRSQAASLWNVLDRDGSGSVDRTEFGVALENLQKARAWSRYCPDCIYANTCSYCQECNADCDFCTHNSFCAAHWSDHPALNKEEDVSADGVGRTHVNTGELLRDTLVIRPLQWAYGSPMMRWVPVAQKAALRRALRGQQLASQDARARAKEEEAAARQARFGQG